jgi:hypothetical protein
MQIDGTSTAARPFCRRASRSSADGRNTDAAEGFLLSRIAVMAGARRRLEHQHRDSGTAIPFARLSRLPEMSQLLPLCNDRKDAASPRASAPM